MENIGQRRSSRAGSKENRSQPKLIRKGKRSSRNLSHTEKGSLPCHVCDIIKYSTEKTATRALELGTVAKILSSNFIAHHPLILRLLKGLNFRNRSEIIYLSKRPGEPAILLPSGVPMLGFGLGKIVDPHWIDSSLLIQWKERCASQHGERCQVSRFLTTRSLANSAFLVDTWRMCLTHASSSHQYVAISYVWGDKGREEEFLKTKNANLAQFLKDQAFSSSKNLSKIPQTIKDAIYLVGILKERYLWVDSLCIVQDDTDTLQEQLDNMGLIYANSIFTIIAADGESADYGLRGIRGVSAPRLYSQAALELSKCETIITRQRCDPHTVWSTRSWTFQEYLLSQKRLVFIGNTVCWECACNTWREDSRLCDDEYFDDRPERQLHLAPFLRWPDLESYIELVDDYNRRDLTHLEDINKAFARIKSLFSRAFKGGFLWGLPELFFDVALLWQPQTEVVRRIPVDTTGKSHIPSWSWLCNRFGS